MRLMLVLVVFVVFVFPSVSSAQKGKKRVKPKVESKSTRETTPKPKISPTQTLVGARSKNTITTTSAPRVVDGKVRPAHVLLLNQILRRTSAKTLKRRAFELDFAALHAQVSATVRAENGKKNSRVKRAYKALKSRTSREKKPNVDRNVVISGGGPSGALAAIQAFHLGHTVTIIEQRTANTLPIVWNNRQQSRDILATIDPVLEQRVFARGSKAKGILRSGEVFQKGKETLITRPKLMKVGKRPSNNPLEIGRSPSTWQSQARQEVTTYWTRINELAKIEEKSAKKEGRKPRLTILRGYQVTKLPTQGLKRSVVAREMVPRLEKNSTSGNRKPKRRKFKEGQVVPEGWTKVMLPLGKRVRLKAPDDVVIAEGAGSSTRRMAGGKFLDVGPNTQYIAGFLDKAKFGSHPDASGNGGGQRGVVRRGLRTTKSGQALRQIALSPSNLNGVWALPEVDPKLNFDSPRSIKKYFGKAMSKDSAVRKYYAQEIAPLLGRKPSEIENTFSFGPGAFVLQSHVAGPVAKNASNVHLIGDSRGNSHFLSSLGKVTGTGTHQLSLRSFWESLRGGTNEKLARAILDKRLDAGTVAWLKLGLQEFTGAGGVNLGAEAAAQLNRQNNGTSFGSNSTRRRERQSEDPTVNR